VVVACLAAIGGGAVALAIWQWLAPAGFDSYHGMNPRAVNDWRRAVFGPPGDRPSVSLALYTGVFRTLVLEMWFAYAVLVWRVHTGSARPAAPPPTARQVLRVAIPVIALLALLAPAGLSTDVFAYVGYGRLAAVHHLNPHLHTQMELRELGDPTTPYLRWPIASPYGPLWTIVSVLIVKIAPAGAVLVPVIVFKLLGGAAVVTLALLVRRINRDLDGDERRADGLLAAVIANPILLIEGPGNAHNDLAMMAAVLAALALFARGRVRAAALLAGVAAAVKLLPLMLVPWLAIAAARARAGTRTAAPPSSAPTPSPAPAGRRWLAGLWASAAVVALALAPLVLAYAPFWSGWQTLGGLATRWQNGYWVQPAQPSLGAMVGRVAPLVIGVGAASLWAIMAPAGEAARRTVTAWAWATLAVLMFATGTGLWYPWYLAWIWPAVLIRTTVSHRLLVALLLPVGVLLTLLHAIASF
jgi:hypothetical protein